MAFNVYFYKYFRYYMKYDDAYGVHDDDVYDVRRLSVFLFLIFCINTNCSLILWDIIHHICIPVY